MRYVEKAYSSLCLYANGTAVVPIEKEIYDETAGLYEALASQGLAGLGGGASGPSEEKRQEQAGGNGGSLAAFASARLAGRGRCS